jgi:hypothetical protein
MVMRYWGERAIAPEDFAHLVDHTEAGIRTATLTAALRARGWTAEPFSGTAALVRHHLARGRPVISLIQVRPGRYHYVVVLGWTGNRVLIHDPARAPYEVIDERGFEARWAATERWSLLILPGAWAARPDSVASEIIDRFDEEALPADTLNPSPHHCGPLIAEAIQRAGAGDLTTAEARLEMSLQLCPSDVAPWREMAGLRFLQSRWPEVSHLAGSAVALDPDDRQAWQLLAASRFLLGDGDGALRAWNRTGGPRIDLARIQTPGRTRPPVFSEVLDLPAHTVLTDDRLRRARRRIAELPTVLGSRVSYRPVADGLAEIDVAVLERPLVPRGRLPLASTSLRVLTEREVMLDVASPTGAGELWTASWRWWPERPRVGVSLAVPRLWGRAGIWRVEGAWEQQAFGFDAASPGPAVREGAVAHREDRRRVALSASDWATADLRWHVGAGLDTWRHRGRHLTVSGHLERRMARDRLALRAGGGHWSALGGAAGFRSGELLAKYRSSIDPVGPIWLGRAGLQATSALAPLDLWPGAGTGHAREPLLRAHPLLDGGVIHAGAFGLTLAHGGLETQLWLRQPRPVRLGFAVFTDVARPWRSPNPADLGLHVDAGIGVRMALPGQSSILRADLARGLRDGNLALSLGWQKGWSGSER